MIECKFTQMQDKYALVLDLLEALLGEKQIVTSAIEVRLQTGLNVGHAFPFCKC